MKPTYLRFHAFGPYPETAEIDFTQFESGLFLISGPTEREKPPFLTQSATLYMPMPAATPVLWTE